MASNQPYPKFKITSSALLLSSSSSHLPKHSPFFYMKKIRRSFWISFFVELNFGKCKIWQGALSLICSSMAMAPGWSTVPPELLDLVSGCLETCFDIVHFRSVCRLWRSSVPPCSFQMYLKCFLPIFGNRPHSVAGEEFCYVEKIPVFVFRFLVDNPTQDSVPSLPSSSSTSSPSSSSSCSSYNWWISGIREYQYGITNLLSPIDDLGIHYKNRVSLNSLNCQIFFLGNVYRFFYSTWKGKLDRNVDMYAPDEAAVIHIDENEGDFAVLVVHSFRKLAVFRTTDMTWKILKTLDENCESLVSFKGKFYAIHVNGITVVIKVPSLEFHYLPTIGPINGKRWLVESGNELLLVEISPLTFLLEFFLGRYTRCRVLRLDEEAREWVQIEGIGDRVLLLGWFGKFSCSANVLPGFQGNCVIVDLDVDGYEALVFSVEDGSSRTVNSVTGNPAVSHRSNEEGREEAKWIRRTVKATLMMDE